MATIKERKAEPSGWFQQAELDDRSGCSATTRCSRAEPNGNCDSCDTIDGRWIEAVNEYASTCDGPCQELTHHELLRMDPETQLGYCKKCVRHLPKEVQDRLEPAP